MICSRNASVVIFPTSKAGFFYSHYINVFLSLLSRYMICDRDLIYRVIFYLFFYLCLFDIFTWLLLLFHYNVFRWCDCGWIFCEIGSVFFFLLERLKKTIDPKKREIVADTFEKKSVKFSCNWFPNHYYQSCTKKSTLIWVRMWILNNSIIYYTIS